MKTSKCKYYCLFILLILLNNVSHAAPEIYLFLGGGPAQDSQALLQNPHIVGAQIIYAWKRLEPRENVYDLTAIKNDLQFLQSIHKKLFIQIQDRSFDSTNIPVPSYLLTKKYAGGIAEQIDFSGEGKPYTAGWVTKQWEPRVQQRFQKLLIALGENFDGKIAGINLPETAIDLSQKNSADSFTCNDYFNATLANLKILRTAFKQSAVVQSVNFFPCEWEDDHHYMSRLFSFAQQNNIGLGGPDVVPYRKAQMKNSYPFFNQYKGQLSLVAFAVQEPDYTYTDPKNHQHFTIAQIYSFADNYLGANILFWNTQEPQYSKEFLPFLKQLKN